MDARAALAAAQARYEVSTAQLVSEHDMHIAKYKVCFPDASLRTPDLPADLHSGTWAPHVSQHVLPSAVPGQAAGRLSCRTAPPQAEIAVLRNTEEDSEDFKQSYPLPWPSWIPHSS
jgi:hypothetical protein